MSDNKDYDAHKQAMFKSIKAAKNIAAKEAEDTNTANIKAIEEAKKIEIQTAKNKALAKALEVAKNIDVNLIITSVFDNISNIDISIKNYINYAIGEKSRIYEQEKSYNYNRYDISAFNEMEDNYYNMINDANKEYLNSKNKVDDISFDNMYNAAYEIAHATTVAIVATKISMYKNTDMSNKASYAIKVAAAINKPNIIQEVESIKAFNTYNLGNLALYAHNTIEKFNNSSEKIQYDIAKIESNDISYQDAITNIINVAAKDNQTYINAVAEFITLNPNYYDTYNLYNKNKLNINTNTDAYKKIYNIYYNNTTDINDPFMTVASIAAAYIANTKYGMKDTSSIAYNAARDAAHEAYIASITKLANSNFVPKETDDIINIANIARSNALKAIETLSSKVKIVEKLKNIYNEANQKAQVCSNSLHNRDFYIYPNQFNIVIRHFDDNAYVAARNAVDITQKDAANAHSAYTNAINDLNKAKKNLEDAAIAADMAVDNIHIKAFGASRGSQSTYNMYMECAAQTKSVARDAREAILNK